MPAPEKLEIRKMLVDVKNRINRETGAVGKIYTEEISRANLSTTALAIANTAKQANRGLDKVRRKNTPVLPSSMDFDIPSRYKKTTDGRRYLLADKVQHVGEDVEKRILVYSTDKQLRLLFTSSHIMMDGTFASCPLHFDQIYSIHCMKNNQSCLCVIALMCGRSSVIYKELFSILIHHAHRLQMRFHPTTITTDYELAMVKTIAEEFPNARHIGCYFHFTNSIIKQIQCLNLTTVYRDDEHARSTTRQLMTLPFIPLDHTRYIFDKIADTAPRVMKPLISYFENYWIRKMRWSLWNVHGVEHRWNHRFNRLVAKFHPNVWHLFDCFRTEEVCVRQAMLKMTMGEKKQTKKKTADFQQRLDSLQSQFDDKMITIDELFEGLILLVATKN
ncbi:unnamed protein product [Rotaria sp. Silwood2]|nr:unnamed protein product [Rotaria sp. Silwood2]CAF3188995.1 unnamed protein product [Rotaria sp. Silwood2]CAF3359606.1 unnamed protein product [Rotaria sp. Silwood2]CAF3454864.1 unnamed protein product [Rotaria sp. Silwood2]CAF4000646.1 unnamed protein product [Rotaria sp. Silwood2]